MSDRFAHGVFTSACWKPWPVLRVDMVNQLEDAGFEVLHAADADTAIALLDVTPRVRLLFTDIDMPGSMDGLKLAAAVRNRWPPIKIIVTSGHRLVDAFEIPEGSVFFGKPYRHMAVIQSIRQLLAA